MQLLPSRLARKPRLAKKPRARCSLDPPPIDNVSDAENAWLLALETLFLQALQTYYQGTPMFTDSEFETLREELEHLGSAQVRLGGLEKLWVQATSARDFDRRVKAEFEMSDDELVMIKDKLLRNGTVKRPKGVLGRLGGDALGMLGSRKFVGDATKIEAGEQVEERLKWYVYRNCAGRTEVSHFIVLTRDYFARDRLLFSDASEERFKILLLYLPAVVMSFVTASVFTILFALLDGEMRITLTPAGQFRLGILSYVVVMLTFWFSNQVTPVMLDYLDLGHPILMRGDCPICGAPISCLFTGSARNREERRCTVCGTTIGFNRKWSKVYMVAPPGSRNFQDPD